MNVKKLTAYIQAYKQFLKRDRELKEIYKYETVLHFQQNWDIDAPDFGQMYDRSLYNSTTKRLWKREHWLPEAMMQKLISTDQEFVRRMFRDLFDEKRPPEQRISRFKFGCDEMLRDYKMQNPTTIENNHYHDDNEMVFFYLTCRYPEEYCFFDYPAFRQTLSLLGIIDLPGPYDVERFLKLTKILYAFLKRDEALMTVHQRRRQAAPYYAGESKLIVHDFYRQAQQLKL